MSIMHSTCFGQLVNYSVRVRYNYLTIKMLLVFEVTAIVDIAVVVALVIVR